MPLDNLIKSVVFRKGRSLKIELREFEEHFNMEQISTAGYLKQRMKLNPEALKDLAQYHARQFYDDNSAQRLKGHLVFAGDGGFLNVPSESSEFANASTKGTKARPQAPLHCMCDVINRMIVDLDISTHRVSERDMAMIQIDNAVNVVGDKPCIYVFDRGYPSGEFFLDLQDRKKLFLVRLSEKTFKREQANMVSDDCEVEIVFDRSRIKVHLNTKTGDRLKKAGSIKLRFVRILLSTGEYEYLATNLSPQEFSTSEIGELYRMRWGIETVFDDLKNKLQIENFTGTKQIIIKQDIYATMYLLNLASDIMQSVEITGNYKHKMQLNRNMAFGIIKEELIRMILAEDMVEKQILMCAIVQELERHILPVRPNRIYKRNKCPLASKHHNTKKRCY